MLLRKKSFFCEIISICNEFPVLGGRYHIHKTMEWDIRVFESIDRCLFPIKSWDGIYRTDLMWRSSIGSGNGNRELAKGT